MKKILVFGVMSLMLFASCRKNRVCVCTYLDGSGSYTENYPLTTKGDAKTYCEAEEQPGYTSCELN